MADIIAFTMYKTKTLPEDVVHFLQNQRFVIVSTIGKDASIHASCKGIIKIDPKGEIYLLDLYRGATYENLKRNPQINITAVDEHQFRGYSLRGKAEVIKEDRLRSHIVKMWEERITSRITHRIIKNIRGEKGHSHYPEVLLPKPEYMILMKVKDVTNLTPHRIKSKT